MTRAQIAAMKAAGDGLKVAADYGVCTEEWAKAKAEWKDASNGH